MKINKCYVHIGPPKSGSTALQSICKRNAEKLKSQSIFYPTFEANQRFLVSSFMRKPELFDYNKSAGRYEIKDIFNHNEIMIRKFEDQLKESNCDTLVVSSEHLVLLDKNEISDLYNYLRELCSNLYAVCYARNPSDAVSSFIQESVKNGARSLEDMEINPPFIRYQEILPKWEYFFGKNLLVKKYQDGFIEDFLSIIGYKDKVDYSQHCSNKSLSQEAVLTLNWLNKNHPEYSRENKLKYVSNMTGKKYEASLKTINKVIKDSQSATAFLEKKYGIIF